MLGKLLKAEFKATRRVFFPILGLIIMFSVILSLFIHPAFQRNDDSRMTEILAGISILLYVIVVVGSVIASTIVVIQRFYKHLLGEEGYLMFTLPVPTWQHIVTKGLLAIFWIVLALLTGILSVLIISRGFGEIPYLLNELGQVLQYASETLALPRAVLVLEGLIVFLVSIGFSLLMVYASVAIGHLWSNHRLLGAIGGFLGLQAVVNLLTMLFSWVVADLLSATTYQGVVSGIFFSDYLINGGAQQVNQYVLLSTLFSIVLGAGLFALTNYILNRKLNLE